MPISGLDSFLKKCGALLDSPISDLQNGTIGVDVAHFLTTLLPANGPNSHKFEPLGGFPLNFIAQFDALLETLKLFNIKLVFVFAGLDPVHILESKKTPSSITSRSEISHLNAWKANKPFRDSDMEINTRSIDTLLMELLIERDIEYQVAPYFSNHQLKYLLNVGLIDAMFTSNDSLLLFSQETQGGKVITNFSIPTNRFHYIDFTFMLQSIQLSFRQFRQLALFVGNKFQPYPISPDGFESSIMKYQSLINQSLKLQDNKTKFLKGLALTQFAPVLKLDGRVESIPLNSKKLFLEKKYTDPAEVEFPGDIYLVLGPKLPDEFFFYQSIGLTCFNIIESISFPIERLPIDMLTSPMYESLVNSDLSIKIRGDLINLLTLKFNRAFQRSPINLVSYLKTKPVEDAINRNPPAYIKFVDSLVIHQRFGDRFLLDHFVKNLSDEYLSECITRDNKLLSTDYELIGTSLLRSMVTYELITTEGGITKWLSSLTKFLKSNNFNAETALLITLLFKRLPNMSKTMLLTPKVSPLTDPKIEICDEISIISKLATLYKSKITDTATSFQAPVSRELRHFISITSKLTEEVNESISVHMVKLLLSNTNDYEKISRDSKKWREISSDMPFKCPQSTVSGLMIQTVLEQSSTGTPINLSQFENVIVNPLEEAQNALKFVLKTIKFIDSLTEDELVNSEIGQLMKSSKLLVESIKL